MEQYIIQACSGKSISARKGQSITIIDVEGGQVVDFFATIAGDNSEFVSPGVTIDCNESFRLNVGDIIYTNKYHEMFQVIYDDVKEHDLIHPCCRKEMYDFFYHNGDGHPNCFDNINNALGTSYPIIHPVNIFMYTKIQEDGKITVLKPLSKKGDKITLKALENVTLGIAACSVSESQCNSGKCSPIEVVVE